MGMDLPRLSSGVGIGQSTSDINSDRPGAFYTMLDLRQKEVCIFQQNKTIFTLLSMMAFSNSLRFDHMFPMCSWLWTEL